MNEALAACEAYAKLSGISLCLDVSLLTPFALSRVPIADSLPKRVVYFVLRENTPKNAAVMGLLEKMPK